ncbi:MAG TPA: ABC transporter substrate-binding protein, partial [Gemmatimonadales bacterium]|nr:ABC transporter substrate-binding protein [Gemmatimonadales bacterium]
MRPPVVCLLLLALACSSAPRRADTVILASGADLQSANPLLTTHPLARQVQRYALLVTLVRYDSTLAPVPYLARWWRWSKDSSTITMGIYAGLSWHDGAPTTARDAAWTLEMARNPATGYPRQTDLAALRSATAPDDTTLVLEFSRPVPRMPDVLTDLALLPHHLLDSVPPADLRRAAWNQRPVGNGPFRFVAHEANRRWIFVRNPGFPAAL